MIIFTIVYPKNDRLAEGAQQAIYDRFGPRPDLSSRRVVQYVKVQDSASFAFRLIRNRNNDIPLTVELLGGYGITTKDVFENYKLGNPRSKLIEDCNLEFGLSKVCVLGRPPLPKPNWSSDRYSESNIQGERFFFGQPLIVATKSVYLNLTLEYFKKQNVNPKIITPWYGDLEGLVELMWAIEPPSIAPLGADLIVESVETGKTAEENGLIEYDKIMDSRAIWIRNPK